MEGKAYIKI